MNIYILLHYKYAFYFLDIKLILLIDMIIRLTNIVNILKSLFVLYEFFDNENGNMYP